MYDNLLSVHVRNMTVDFRAAAYVEQPKEDGLYNYIPEFSSIGYICNGDGAIVVEGIDLQPKAGDMYLLPAKTVQSYYSVNDTPYKKYYCHFQATSGGRSFFDIVKVPLRLPVQDRGTVVALFEELCSLQPAAHPFSILRIKSLVEQLLYIYLSSASSISLDPPRAKKQEAVENALLYIEEHLDQELSIRQLAGRLFLHPDYFARIFKEVTGGTPRQYILQCRNQKAIGLLLSTSLSISEIAAQTGFDNQFYFSRVFKKINGVTPSEFRKF